jgi:hypothetical protein
VSGDSNFAPEKPAPESLTFVKIYVNNLEDHMSSSQNYPQLVMIIRHGEKPGDPASDSSGGLNLSILGSARAAALPSLFTPDPAVTPPVSTLQQLGCDVAVGAAEQFSGTYVSSGLTAGQPRFPVPNFLFATQASKNSSRPIETITPLSQALADLTSPGTSCQLNSRINCQYPNDSYKELAAEILNNPQTYGGQVVLICWHHGKAPKLARHLGVSKKELAPWDPWPPAVFDLVFQITWHKSGKAHLDVGYQQLLFNDTKTPSAAS